MHRIKITTSKGAVIDLEASTFNLTSWRQMEKVANSDTTMQVRKPVGDTISVITCNMPESLREKINKLVEDCYNPKVT